MVNACSVRFVAGATLSLLLAPVLTPAQTTRTSGPKATAATSQKTAHKAHPAPATLQLEPKALDVLRAVSDRLKTARTISFVAVETFESLSRQGAPLVLANRFEVTLRRPDRLKVILAGDGPSSEFYYNGKTMMAYAPAENTVAVAEAPATIDAALEAIFHKAAIYFPFTDLIVADPYGDLAPGLKHAYYVGQSHVVGDTTTDIVAFAGDNVFVQVWVGTEDHLPRAMHAVFLNDPDELRHNMILSNWQIDAPAPDELFTSAKAASAKRMEFEHPHPEATQGTMPGQGRPSPKAKPFGSLLHLGSHGGNTP